ncbi:uncharacterized protein C1orf232 homolog [Sphaerodactylus townsendi]|uniref:Uncharacterized protein n=1 Tax=Sphaerodactylus townsendi TaxID=933632 RepID=A0ACB8FQ33_9SAUR|nr:uncharacterized protein C1orf232 homolog [Sphaerodactylus townsendi]
MTQAFWKVYKAKVMQTLGGEPQEEDIQDERDNPELMETTDSTLLTEEGANPVSQLARRVQGVGARGWKTMSALFTKEDEHQLLAPEPCADHPLAARPAEEPSIEKKAAGLWDIFATKWQQTAALEKMAVKPNAQEEVAEGSEGLGEVGAEEASNASHTNDLREAEGVAFKWSFLTSKLVEMKKNVPKSN